MSDDDSSHDGGEVFMVRGVQNPPEWEGKPTLIRAEKAAQEWQEKAVFLNAELEQARTVTQDVNAEVEEELDRADGKVKTAQQRLKSMHDRLKRYKTIATRAKDSQIAVDEEREELTAQRYQLQSDRAELEGSVFELAALVEALEERERQLTHSLDDALGRIAEGERRLQDQRERAEDTRQALLSEIRALKEAHASELEEERASHADEREQMQTKHDMELEDTYAALKGRAEETRQAHEEEVARLQRELDIWSKKAQSLESELRDSSCHLFQEDTKEMGTQTPAAARRAAAAAAAFAPASSFGSNSAVRRLNETRSPSRGERATSRERGVSSYERGTSPLRSSLATPQPLSNYRSTLGASGASLLSAGGLTTLGLGSNMTLPSGSSPLALVSDMTRRVQALEQRLNTSTPLASSKYRSLAGGYSP